MYSQEGKAREFNEQDFKEVQIRDFSGAGSYPSYAANTFSPQPAYESSNPGFRPVELDRPYPPPLNNGQPIQLVMEQAPGISPPNARDVKFQIVLSQARVIKWIAVVETLFCILFIVSGLFFLIFLLILPILGYFAARRLSRRLMLAFMLYLILIIILRIILIAVVDNTFFRIIEVIMILINLGFLRYSIRFYRLLGTIDPQEKAELLILQNGVSRNPPPSNAQDPAMQFQPEVPRSS